MSFSIRAATRTGVIPLVGFFGKSGSGKTMSALLLARGLVGPKGRVVLIDTESGRGHIFADVIPGGYSVIDLDAPFSPDRYLEAFETAEKDADVVVIDSMTHEHAGEGGVLDWQDKELDRMAGDNYAKREACKMAAWIKPKQSHKKMVGRLLRSKVPLICCLRGEEKTKIVKGQGNEKSKVVTDDFSTPIFDKNFIFEMLLNFETVEHEGKGGYVFARKITHPDLAKVVPAEGDQIGIKHGEAIARWAQGGGTEKAEPKPRDPLKTAKAALWAAAEPKFKTVPAFTDWLRKNGYLGDTQTLDALTAEQLTALVQPVEDAEDPNF